MDPDAPFRSQLYAKFLGRLQLTDHFNIWSRYEQDIHNDFSTDRPPDSPHLPNVRTLVNRYLVEGESGLELLYAEYKKSLSSSVHTRTYAGLLESMYGGIGGEVLYAPYRQRWAIGVNLNAVRQRGFKRNFDFRDYKTITGHVSVYYASPFFNIDVPCTRDVIWPGIVVIPLRRGAHSTAAFPWEGFSPAPMFRQKNLVRALLIRVCFLGFLSMASCQVIREAHSARFYDR